MTLKHLPNYLAVYLSAFVFTLFLISGCERESPEPIPTTLELKVVDENSDPVNGAEVTLFGDLESWLSEQNPLLPPAESGDDGLAVFQNIDTGTYFIDIKKDNLNNWESGAKKTVFANLINTATIEIFESKSGLLSNAQGKKWILTGRLIEEQDIYDFLDPCEKDGEIIFYKGALQGEISLLPGEIKCDENEANQEDGIWRLTSDQRNLDIQLPFETIRWTIEELTETTLVFSYIEPFTGFFYEDTYTAQ